MCLKLSKDWKRNRENARSKRKPIKAYKVVNCRIAASVGAQTSFKASYYSPMRCYSGTLQYPIGEVVVSNRTTTKIQANEGSVYGIATGIHLMSTLSGAKEVQDVLNRNYPNENQKILEVYIKPSDVVAVGTFNTQGKHLRSIVVTKCKVVREVS